MVSPTDLDLTARSPERAQWGRTYSRGRRAGQVHSGQFFRSRALWSEWPLSKKNRRCASALRANCDEEVERANYDESCVPDKLLPLWREKLMMRLLCKSMLCVALVCSASLNARAADPVPAGATLTDESLREMLVKMGYQPTEKKYADGVKYYSIQCKVAGLDWPVTVELAPNKRIVMFGICLGKHADEMDRDQLIRILKENDRLKNRFLIEADKGKDLYMTGYFDNRFVTADLLQKELDIFLAEVKQTEALWKPVYEGRKAAPVRPAPKADPSIPVDPFDPLRPNGGDR